MSISSVDDSAGRSVANASSAERDATRRIDGAYKAVQTVQKDADEQIELIRDSYERKASTESARDEEQLEHQRSKGYEQIRNLQKSQQSELKRVKKEKEKEIADLQANYRNTLSRLESNSKEQLHNTQSQGSRELNYEIERSRDELEALQLNHQASSQRTREQAEAETIKMKDQSQQALAKIGNDYQSTVEQTQDRYNHLIGNIEAQNTSRLGRIYQDTKTEISRIQNENSYLLSAYQTRQNDPFYKLLNMNAQFRDLGDSYELTCTVPEYEQEHISASIKGNNLVVAGNRRNEEKLDLGPGHSVSSSNFQSYNESFPLSWPVESHLLTKEFKGNLLTIRVPKKNEFAFKAPEPRLVERIRVTPPIFPESLPKYRPQNDEPTEGSPLPQKKGSGTLE